MKLPTLADAFYAALLLTLSVMPGCFWDYVTRRKK